MYVEPPAFLGWRHLDHGGQSFWYILEFGLEVYWEFFSYVYNGLWYIVFFYVAFLCNFVLRY